MGRVFRAVSALGVALLASAPLATLAEDAYPTRPITLVVPVAAGGGESTRRAWAAS